MGICDFDASSLCQELLGVIPSLAKLRGSVVYLSWLSHHLSTPSTDVNEVTLDHKACGFILALLGSFLFANKKGLHVHLCFLPLLRDLMQTFTYSWSSAVLAHLYRELCQASCDGGIEIAGCITLLQVLIIFFINIHIKANDYDVANIEWFFNPPLVLGKTTLGVT